MRESFENLLSLPVMNTQKGQLGIEFGSVVWEATDVTIRHRTIETVL
jgi:hypothetical protein